MPGARGYSGGKFLRPAPAFLLEGRGRRQLSVSKATCALGRVVEGAGSVEGGVCASRELALMGKYSRGLEEEEEDFWGK